MEAKYFILSDHCQKTDANFKCYYAFGKNQVSALHYHDYYEIFVTITDNLIHVVNGVQQVLPSGTLAFIRASDRHHFCFDPDKDNRHINLSFNEKIIFSLFEYISNKSFHPEKLLNSPLPPMYTLSPREQSRIIDTLLSFNNTYDVKEAIDLKMRAFLVDIFTRYFCDNVEIKPKGELIPYWLESTLDKMNKYSNFSEGLPRMIEISGKSREHLHRSVKKYLGITASEYINNLRLDYAAGLLINSNLPVLDICYESGFENISHFYTLFNGKFNLSPKKYRDLNKAQIKVNHSVIIGK